MTDSKWPPLKRLPQVGEVYLHRNGLAYEVVALANDPDKSEIFVIHEGADGTVWSRTIGNFTGLKDGSARFRLNQDENIGGQVA